MKFVTYTATPNLKRFPEPERFRVWRSTHKQLMKTDASYCQRVHRFSWRIVWLAIAFTIISVAIGRFPGTRFAVKMQVAAYLVVTVLYLTYVLRFSFGLQQFMNERIGKALSEQTG